jgi:hypothetical protein
MSEYGEASRKIVEFCKEYYKDKDICFIRDSGEVAVALVGGELGFLRLQECQIVDYNIHYPDQFCVYDIKPFYAKVKEGKSHE